jgi:phosphate transport system substrate-binding protein
MKRKFIAASLIFCLMSTFTTEIFAQKKPITIKGSDTMVILVQRWSELFRNKYKIDFQVTGGGSGTGIAALINGTTDICASSRPIKPEEVKQLKDKFNSKGVEVRVARDGIAIYVHKKNPVSKLTMEQIRDIFMGNITNWKQVGGPDKKITLYSRENNSGTYEFFKEHVLLKKDFAASAQNMPGTAALINAISKDQYSIGFGGAAYAKDVKEVLVAKDAKGAYVEPNEANILSGKYPISRFLYFYVVKRPEGEMKKFIDWVISAEGQKVVSEVGYYPIKK